MSSLELSTLEREIAPVLQRANTITVRSADDRTDAMDFLRAVKSANKRASEFFAPIVDAAHKSWKQATASRGSILEPLEAAEKRVKATVITYDQEQERIRQEEQRRLQAIADEAARRERERLEKQAAKLKTPEKREAKLEEAAAVIAPVVQIAEPEKPKGEVTKQRWKMKLTDKTKLIAAAASGNDLAASLLAYDESAGNRIAPSLNDATTPPGVALYPVGELAVKV
jgi:hypothetical protein